MPFEQFRQPPKGAEKKPAYAESYGEAKEEPMRVAFETREGEKFWAETLTSPEDPRVEKVQRMLTKRFGKNEVDPVETMKQAMTGEMETGEKCPRYLVTVVENEKGEVVAMASGAAVELVDKRHRVSKSEAVLLDAYTVVSPELQKKGVDEHLFEMRERAALQDAEKRGLKLVGYIVEDGGEDEKMYNRYGAERVYDNLPSKKESHGHGQHGEVVYYQPPLDWDEETGKPAEGAGVVREHLMVKLFHGGLDREMLKNMVRGMFFYNNEREREYFTSERAYRTHIRFLRSMEEEFVARVDRSIKDKTQAPLLQASRSVRISTNKQYPGFFREPRSEQELEALEEHFQKLKK